MAKFFDKNIAIAVVLVAAAFGIAYLLTEKEFSFQNGMLSMTDKPSEEIIGNLKVISYGNPNKADALKQILSKDEQIIRMYTFDGPDARNSAMAATVAELVVPLQNNKKKIGIFGSVENPKNGTIYCNQKVSNVSIGNSTVAMPKESCVQRGGTLFFSCDDSNKMCTSEDIIIQISTANAVIIKDGRVEFSGTKEWLLDKRVDFGQLIGFTLNAINARES